MTVQEPTRIEQAADHRIANDISPLLQDTCVKAMESDNDLDSEAWTKFSIDFVEQLRTKGYVLVEYRGE